MASSASDNRTASDLWAENLRLREQLKQLQALVGAIHRPEHALYGNGQDAATSPSAPHTTACPIWRPLQACPPESSSGTFVSHHGLSKQYLERYSRQVVLESFGVRAQAALCSSSALIVGCGGLGASCALYLAAAGIGRLGLVDKDAVELSNLHRQVIHTEAMIGVHKAVSAAAACRQLNSTVHVSTHVDGLCPAGALDLVDGYDVVLDCSDNPATRYLISDACVLSGKPLVSGAALGTDGQLAVYCHAGGPCYRCLFPQPPPADACGRCSETGVLGVVPGLVGIMQALEAIKVLTGIGDVLSQRLMVIDALSGAFRSMKLRGKSPTCVACGPDPVLTRANLAQYDYQQFTSQRADDGPLEELHLLGEGERMTPKQLQAELLQAPAGAAARPVLLDVRPAAQFAAMHLPGAVSMPLRQLSRQRDKVLALCSATLTHTREPSGVEDTSGTGEQSSQNLLPVLRSGDINEDSANGATDPDPGEVGSKAALSSAETGPSAGVGHSPRTGLGPSDGAESQGPPGQGQDGELTPGGRRVVVLCRRGNDSQLVVRTLQEWGVRGAVDLEGGYLAWARDVDPLMPLL